MYFTPFQVMVIGSLFFTVIQKTGDYLKIGMIVKSFTFFKSKQQIEKYVEAFSIVINVQSDDRAFVALSWENTFAGFTVKVPTDQLVQELFLPHLILIVLNPKIIMPLLYII